MTDKKEKKKDKKPEPKPKYYFDIKVETLLPATLSYRVLAETPEEAVLQIKNLSPTSVKYKLFGRKDIKLIVYEAGCSFIKFIKNLK